MSGDTERHFRIANVMAVLFIFIVVVIALWLFNPAPNIEPPDLVGG